MKPKPNHPIPLSPEEDPELVEYLKKNDWMDFQMPDAYFAGLEKQIMQKVKNAPRESERKIPPNPRAKYVSADVLKFLKRS